MADSRVPTVAPYGEWLSPITPQLITAAGIGLEGVGIGSSGSLFWLEARPNEGGRYVVCRHAPGEEGASERGGVDVTPTDSNVRTRVHEYGGGAFTISPDPTDGGAEVVIYANYKDQRLYKVATSPGTPATPVCLTPEGPAFATDALYRFADGVVDQARRRFVCVREDHTEPDPSKVVNALVSVSLDGSGAVEVLASGFDFYGAPRLSPGGDRVAYLRWNHPSMPWDATELVVLALPGSADAGSEVMVAAGDASNLQPAWCPATGGGLESS